MDWQGKTIVNGCGLKLSALLRPAEPLRDKSSTLAEIAVGGQPRLLPPLVIVCHGFTGSKEGGGGAVDMGDELARRGFATLLFDFSGSGESEGLWEEITLSRQVDDLGAVVEWARLQGYRRIILNGRSFGGATVLAYTASDAQIAAVCTWAALAHPLQLFSSSAGSKVSLEGSAFERITLDDGTGSITLQRRFFQDLQRHDLLHCASRITPRPLLLIHGTADEVVPLSHAHLLFDAAGEPKRLAQVKDADHRFTDYRRQVWEIFFNWLDCL